MNLLNAHTILLLLMCFVYCNSCKSQLKSNATEDSIENSNKIIDNGLGLPKTTVEMKSYLDPGVDPYFIETKDTFSKNGPKCIVRNLIQTGQGIIGLLADIGS